MTLHFLPSNYLTYIKPVDLIHGAMLQAKRNRDFEDNLFKLGKRMQADFDKCMLESLLYFKEHGHFKQPTEDEKLRDRLKYAKIIIDGKSIITLADNKTNEAYVMQGEWYTNSWKLKEPIEKESRPYEFERWATSFDL